MTVLDSSNQVESEKQEETGISSLCNTDVNTTWAVAVQTHTTHNFRQVGLLARLTENPQPMKHRTQIRLQL